jgi:arsenite methyltransferase
LVSGLSFQLSLQQSAFPPLRPFPTSFVFVIEPANWPTEREHNMKTAELEPNQVRTSVREHYGKVATRESGCGCAPTCCSTESDRSASHQPSAVARALGYSASDTSEAPDGANLGLGCGNPLAIASLKPGQTVLDLGSGGGFDAFLAAKAVGASGRVIGVDMTPEMLAKAHRNKEKAGYGNVEFRLGEIENLPVSDNSADVIISNCVINLSPEKSRVFQEAFRVLKPGGRLALSDVVALAPLPEKIRSDLALHAGCVAGASTIEDLEATLASAGFQSIRITPNPKSRAFIQEWFPDSRVEDYIASATIEAVKP